MDAVEKVRLGDLNVYCPGRGLDWRLSCSVERPGEFDLPFVHLFPFESFDPPRLHVLERIFYDTSGGSRDPLLRCAASWQRRVSRTALTRRSLSFLSLPVLQTPTTPGTGARQKDRMSYAHQIVQVDLTQVTTEVRLSFSLASLPFLSSRTTPI